MTNTFKKSLLFALTCLMATTVWAADKTDLTIALSEFTVTDKTYEKTFTSDLKCKNYNLIYAEVPSATASGKVTWRCGSSNSGRWIYIYVKGTTKDESRKIAMKNGYADEVSFTSDDLAAKDGKYYLVFGTADDYKAKSMKYTLENAVPAVSVTGVSVEPASLSLEAGQTATLTATVLPSDATNKKVTWKSNDPSIASVSETGAVTGESVGSTKIIVTTVDGEKTAECSVTVSAATPVPVTAISLKDKTIQEGSSSTLEIIYTPSNANTGKACTWTSSDNSIVVVNNGTVTGIKEGKATITATSTTDNAITASCTVTVTPAAPVPQTDLKTHEPGTYEAKSKDGGYGAALTVFSGREYEVYYVCRDASGSNISISTIAADKDNGITTGTSNSVQANDGWFKLNNSNGRSGDTNATRKDEFDSTSVQCIKFQSGHELTFHVKGFDQFSFYGKDNNKDASKERYFIVYIDDVKQSVNPSDEYTIRRFDITTGEHVIKLTACGSNDSKLTGFSFRVPDLPRTKHLKGNDSTQVILQTQEIKPITYFTKYPAKGETKLVWDGGATVNGFDLKKKASTALGDTIQLVGTALCPVGKYSFRIVDSANGVELNSLSGKIEVQSKITTRGDLTNIEAEQNESMSPIVFTYYALSADDVTLKWTGSEPTGLVGSGKDGTYTISGTPTVFGTFPFTISVKDGNSLEGTIRIESGELGANPVMYLCKTKNDTVGDGIYSFLKGQGKNLKARGTIDTLRTQNQYNKYDWVLISENVDANNEEVLAIIEKGINKPVLNLKGFTYAPGRLDWGEPNNGSVNTTTKNGQNLYVQREDHPIFKALNKKFGDKIEVLSSIDKKGLMPIKITDCDGSFCLATAYTRSIADYYADGERQTVLHEIPASEGKGKYICFPIAQSSSKNLTPDGQKLLNQIITYLLSSEPSGIALPELAITSFTVDGEAATIDQDANTITLEMDLSKHPGISLSALKPQVTVKNTQLTFVTPTSEEETDFASSHLRAVPYEVTDYINRRVYEVTIIAEGAQGIEEVYTSGEWVNVFDIYGRLVTTTNENIYQMELPQGIYMVVTANGATIKLLK